MVGEGACNVWPNFRGELRSSSCCCMNTLHNKTSVLTLCVELCFLHCGRVGGAERKVVSVRDEGVWGSVSVTPLILYIGIECR